MYLIDSHTHLYLPEFKDDLKNVIERAVASGVSKMFLPNIDSTTIESMLKVVANYPSHFFPMMGLHPCSVKENWEAELKVVEENLFNNKVKFYGVGETGLDFYWDKTFIEQQKSSLVKQINWAADLNLPIIIHSRDATNECIELINNENKKNCFGVFHCFSGTLEQAKEIVDMGFYLGIGGVVTFKNGGLDRVLPNLSIDHIVLETDSPYLAPVPHRGKRNESSYLPHVVSKISERMNISEAEVVIATSKNSIKLFSL